MGLYSAFQQTCQPYKLNHQHTGQYLGWGWHWQPALVAAPCFFVFQHCMIDPVFLVRILPCFNYLCPNLRELFCRISALCTHVWLPGMLLLCFCSFSALHALSWVGAQLFELLVAQTNMNILRETIAQPSGPSGPEHDSNQFLSGEIDQIVLSG